MSEKFKQDLEILQSIPVGQRYAIALSGPLGLMDKINKDYGIELELRAMQRRLLGFHQLFPQLEYEKIDKTYYWYWQEKSELISIPTMSLSIALTFKLAEPLLKKLMPTSIINQLAPYFTQASQELSKSYSSKTASWSDKTYAFMGTKPYKIPDISSDMVEVIYMALLNDKKFRGRYKNSDEVEAEYEFSPRGLVLREGIVYLLATLWDYQDIRHFALHRFTFCESIEGVPNITRIPQFNLREYITESGAFEWVQDKKQKHIRFQALFSSEAIRNLSDTPLSKNQSIVEQADGRYLLKATVMNTLHLRWWLMGFGNEIEVLTPKSLREEFKKNAKELYQLYHK